MPEDRLTLRARFNEDALLYHRARPTYPPAVFDAIFDRLPHPLRTAPRVLEIGCGTGQATRPLAERGCEVVAVDLGADMTEVARSNLAAFADVQVAAGKASPCRQVSWPRRGRRSCPTGIGDGDLVRVSERGRC